MCLLHSALRPHLVQTCSGTVHTAPFPVTCFGGLCLEGLSPPCPTLVPSPAAHGQHKTNSMVSLEVLCLITLCQGILTWQLFCVYITVSGFMLLGGFCVCEWKHLGICMCFSCLCFGSFSPICFVLSWLVFVLFYFIIIPWMPGFVFYWETERAWFQMGRKVGRNWEELANKKPYSEYIV